MKICSVKLNCLYLQFTTKGHHFVAHQYFTVTYCNHCQLIIWGIGPQGYQCTSMFVLWNIYYKFIFFKYKIINKITLLLADCILNIHRVCVKVLDENCPGPIVKKDKTNDRISKLMDKIRPERDARRKPGSSFIHSNYYNYYFLFKYLNVNYFFFFFLVERSKRQSEDAGDVVGALPEKDTGNVL